MLVYRLQAVGELLGPCWLALLWRKKAAAHFEAHSIGSRRKKVSNQASCWCTAQNREGKQSWWWLRLGAGKTRAREVMMVGWRMRRDCEIAPELSSYTPSKKQSINSGYRMGTTERELTEMKQKWVRDEKMMKWWCWTATTKARTARRTSAQHQNQQQADADQRLRTTVVRLWFIYLWRWWGIISNNKGRSKKWPPWEDDGEQPTKMMVCKGSWW